jgi:hypothetical protein
MDGMTVIAFVVLGVLVLAVVGLVHLVRLAFGARRPDFVVAPTPEPLTRTEKLGVVWDVLGPRMPEELREEYARLRGWRASTPTAAPPLVEPSPLDEPAPVVTQAPVVTATPVVLPASVVAATPTAIALDERPLVVEPEVAAAAPHAPPWLRSFLSFENVIFLLAACLVLGGTLYVVATTWGHVPGRWRYLFLEGVVLFYGSALLGAAALLDRRLGLGSAARFLGATAAVTSAGAAIVACAAFAQSLASGLFGAGLVAVVGGLDARALLRLEGRRAAAAPVYGAALAGLACVGLLAGDHPGGAAVLLVTAVAAGGPLWLWLVGAPTVALRALGLAPAAAAVLLAVGGWLPAPYVAPALVAAGGSLAVADSLRGPLAPFALIALQAAGLGLAGGDVGLSVAALSVGLVVALGRLRALGARTDRADERPIVAALVAAVWCGLAFLWASAAHLLDAGRVDASAWNGVAALPFALAPLALLRRGLHAEGTRIAAIATGAVIIVGALGLALAGYPALGLPSVVVGLGAAALFYAWAWRARPGAPPWVIAHAVGLLAVWIAVRAEAPGLETAAAASTAVALLLPGARARRLLGTLVVPGALVVALLQGAPGTWLAALAAAFGAAHLARPIAVDEETTRALGPPALVGALALALLAPNGAHAPLVALAQWPLVLAVGVAPLVGWVAWRGGPTFLVVEAMAGLAAVALGGHAPVALGLATVLVVGRRPGAISPASAALGPLAALALVQGGRPEPIAAALAAGGLAMLARPATAEAPAPWYRWLGMPALVGAVLLVAFGHAAGGAPRLSPALWAVAAAGALAPFAFAASRGAPRWLRVEAVAGAGVVAIAALLDAFSHTPASPAAIDAAAGALLALGAGLVATSRQGGPGARVGWIAALLLAPVAIVPTVTSPLALAPALVAVAAVTALGRVSKRLGARDVGAWAHGAALAAAWWLLAAVAKRFSTGAPPEHILPAVAIATALFGVALVLDGARFALSTPAFERGLARVALALAAAFTLAGAVAVGAPGPRDAALTLAALVFIATLALVIAFHARAGWPFYIAESALGAAYAYLRLRTPWLAGLGEWDGVVACAGGLVCLGAERALRRARDGLGAEESRLMATLLPLASALFLRPDEPLTSLGPALAAALLALRARGGGRPVLGWLAAGLANLSLLAVWPALGVRSPVAYALPAGLTLALLADAYEERLGALAGPLRTTAGVLSFAATSWEMFQFQSPWPALVLAATAVGAVLLGIHARTRAYLTFGFTALLLDIVANLTRWGLHDRLVGGALGVAGGVALFGLGAVVARHKELALARYRSVMAWPW